MANNLIFVGGASSSGKSTFVKELKKEYSCDTYRRLDAFKDCAIKKGYDEANMFSYVSSEEADNQFISFCTQHNCVVSDVHYALQRNKDFVSIDGDLSYVATLSNNLINTLLNLNTNISAVLLHCSPEVIYSRMLDRFNRGERSMRSKSVEEVKMQSIWEKKMWEQLIHEFDIMPIELNSELFTPDELVDQFLNFNQSTKSKKKVLVINNGKNNTRNNK